MAGVKLRAATAGDMAGFAECVRAASSHCIERIGRPPGPILDDHDQVVRDHRAHVIKEDGEIFGALVLIEGEDGLLFDNIAVRPARPG